jgi:hypothetical protein
MELHSTVPRKDVAISFDGVYEPQKWDTGCVRASDGSLVLLATLDKKSGEFDKRYLYDDGFVSRKQIRWQSQNRSGPNTSTGKAIIGEDPTTIHLFVRYAKKDKGRTVGFTYFGKVNYRSHEGEKPMTVLFDLETEVPVRLCSLFAVPVDLEPTADPVELEEMVAVIRTAASGDGTPPKGNPKPKKTTSTSSSSQYLRDAEVIAWVLDEASGYCELCGDFLLTGLLLGDLLLDRLFLHRFLLRHQTHSLTQEHPVEGNHHNQHQQAAATATTDRPLSCGQHVVHVLGLFGIHVRKPILHLLGVVKLLKIAWGVDGWSPLRLRRSPGTTPVSPPQPRRSTRWAVCPATDPAYGQKEMHSISETILNVS